MLKYKLVFVENDKTVSNAITVILPDRSLTDYLKVMKCMLLDISPNQSSSTGKGVVLLGGSIMSETHRVRRRKERPRPPSSSKKKRRKEHPESIPLEMLEWLKTLNGEF